jgi:heme/copper-type cytochrome/quinol oxidase subunit 2
LPNNVDTLAFDSVILLDEDLTFGAFRLLEVDTRLLLPANTGLRLFITAADVLHSFAIPSLGIKVDACPGRLNQVGLQIKRVGVFYGQCSEICGVGHGYMPIVVEGIPRRTFFKLDIDTNPIVIDIQKKPVSANPVILEAKPLVFGWRLGLPWCLLQWVWV